MNRTLFAWIYKGLLSFLLGALLVPAGCNGGGDDPPPPAAATDPGTNTAGEDSSPPEEESKRVDQTGEWRHKQFLMTLKHSGVSVQGEIVDPNAADVRPHHDQFILGNGGDRRLQRCDNILKSTKIRIWSIEDE